LILFEEETMCRKIAKMFLFVAFLFVFISCGEESKTKPENDENGNLTSDKDEVSDSGDTGNDDSPITTDDSPITTDDSPITTDDSPITTDDSPLTDEDEVPDDGGDDIPAGPVEFERIVMDDNPMNPAFTTIDDINNDGYQDVVVCHYGPPTNMSMNGRIDIYWGTGDITKWTRETLNLGRDVKFPHPVHIEDLNGDGKKDMIVPAGFLACESNPLGGGSCGWLFWLENKDGVWNRHDIVPFGNELFFFAVAVVDLDGDGITDLLTNGSYMKKSLFGDAEKKEVLMWFKGTNTPTRFETTPKIINEGSGGVFPVPYDITGNGKLDVAAGQYFVKDPSKEGSFVWFEHKSIDNWEKHIINSDSGEGFMLEIIEDLYGDGVTRAVGTNHVNTTDNPKGPAEGVFVFDIPEDPTQPWTKKNISTGIKSRKSPMTGPQAAPGLFGYGDISGNGLTDLVVSGDGDSRVFWFEQKTKGEFTQHTLDGIAGQEIMKSEFGQAGGMKIVDLDNDGYNEIIVTSYEANKIYIYKVKR